MNSRPQIVTAEVEHHTNSITLTVKDCGVVIVGQPVSVPHRQSCALLNYRDPSTNDEATSASKNRISESEGTFTTKQEIVCKDKPGIPQTCNVRVESDSSIMIETHQVSDIDRPLPMITRQGYLNGKQCEEIIETLVNLQDNGKFQDHETLVTATLKLCRETQNFDMELALLLERGVAFSYHREFKKSRQLFTSVINKRVQHPLRNENLLMARAHYLIVDNYVDRFRKVTKKSQSMEECLKTSQLLLQAVDSPQDWAELHYTRGNLGLARMSTMLISEPRHAQARRVVQDDAKHNFELAIMFCKRDPRERIQTKFQRYCHLKVAQLLLDTCSTAALHQQNVLPPDRIEEAKQHLDFVEGELGNGMPLGTRVELLQTRCDQFYRQEKFQLARETAEEAYGIANCNSGFYFLDALQERINLLDRFCESRIRMAVDDDLSTSGSDANYEASSSEPE